jgi:tetratricopeptide (TPR) repeat protein
MKHKVLNVVLIAAFCLQPIATGAQLASAPQRQLEKNWVGQPIVMLHGWGAVHHLDHDLAKTSVGINIVTRVARVEGRRLWVNSTGEDNSGWVDVKDVLLLSEAISYFNSLIVRNPHNWDAYLRRAEAEHALNQRDAATSDYSKAIKLHSNEAFLYLRRGRHYNTLKSCDSALRDFEMAIRLAPKSAKQDYNLKAELYSLESGVYANCPETSLRDPQRAIATARRAVALDSSRPTLLTILAGAYARAGELDQAIKFQQQALDSPRFPPAYREGAEQQLQQYRMALAAPKSNGPP